MNDFESSLASALRAEVEEAAACVDGIRAAQQLESGLDRVDRAQRRRIWVGVVAVGAAAAVISVVALAGRATDHATPIQLIEPPPTSTPAPPPTSSKPSPSESFAAVLSVHLLAGSFDSIGGLAVGPTGTVYVSDFSSTLHRSVIRAITPAGHVTTIADQPATRWDAGFGAVAVDGSGNVYVAAGHAIRKIGPDGQMSTLAGGATPGTVDGIGSKARFDGILGMAISPTGDLYVAGAGVVRKVTPEGKVDTLPACAYPPTTTAGAGDCLGWPGAIAVGPSGTIYIGSDDYRIRTITPDGKVSELAAGAPNVLFSRMSLAFDPFDSVLLVLDTDGVHAVAADGTVSPVSFAAGSLPGHLYRIAVGADGAMYSTDQQASVVTLTRRG